MIAFLAWASFILALASYYYGMRGMIDGPVRPSVISRFFWLFLAITNLFSYANMDAGSGLFLAVACVIGSLLIFLLSLRYGTLEFKRVDLLTIAGSSVALCSYLLLDNQMVTLAAGLLTHFISGIPTYKKTWTHPFTEDLTFWSLFAIASFLSLIGVVLQSKNFIYPLYCLLFDAGMVMLILLRRPIASHESARVVDLPYAETS